MSNISSWSGINKKTRGGKPLSRMGSAIFGKVGGKSMRLGQLSARGMAGLGAMKQMKKVK